MIYKVLIVSKDKDVILAEQERFYKNGVEPTVVLTMDEGIALINKCYFDIIFVDDSSPFFYSSLKIMRELTSATINLTSHDTSVENRKKALQYGCDSYLYCDDNIPRLIDLAIQMVISECHTKTRISYKNLTLFPEFRKLYVDDKEVHLTKREFELVLMFIKAPKQVYTKNQLIDKAWGQDYFSSYDAIYTIINRIRTKINKDSKYKLLHNVRDVGYTLD